MSWELCSREDVMGITPIPERALDDFWSDAVEGMIREYKGMPYLGKQEVILEEEHDGRGTRTLLVKSPPIVSVEAVRISGYTVAPTEYRVTKYGIKLRHDVFPAGVLNVSLDYTSGSPLSGDAYVVDPIVRLTAAAMVVAIWNYHSRAGADGSIKWATAPVAEGEESPNQKVGLTSHLYNIMKRMLRRERLRVQ